MEALGLVQASPGVGLVEMVRCASYSAGRVAHDKKKANYDTVTDEDLRAKPAGSRATCRTTCLCEREGLLC